MKDTEICRKSRTTTVTMEWRLLYEQASKNLTKNHRLLSLVQHFMKSDRDHVQPISDEDVVRLVSEKIPHWRKACGNNDADTVVLQQRAFGSSQDELFLMSIAIRYAGIMHKTVMIVP